MSEINLGPDSMGYLASRNTVRRKEIKGRVTLISIDTVPPKMLPEKQKKISQL
jgi:hypothetical protein